MGGGPPSRFTSDRPLGGAVLRTHVNDEMTQEARLEEMTFGLDVLLAHASLAMTLEPGDLVLTGTPAGVRELADGDRVRVSVDGVPGLEHAVRSE